MKFYIALTNQNWYQNLRYLQPDEVNFWQPGGQARFRALQLGELFLFKLHHPHDYIVGGGYFAHNSILPVSLAWDSFQEKNGASTYDEMRSLIERHRQIKSGEHYNIEQKYLCHCLLDTYDGLVKSQFMVEVAVQKTKSIDVDSKLLYIRGSASLINEGNNIKLSS